MSRRLALPSVISTAAAILILAAGCADQSPTAVQLHSSTSLAAAKVLDGTVVKTSQKYPAASYSKVITENGGSIEFGIGRIDFPAGAVDRPTRITVAVDGEHVAANFEPHGLQFPAGAEPRLSFQATGVAAEDLVIAYVSPEGDILEVLATTLNNTTASGKLRHYSQYVLLMP